MNHYTIQIDEIFDALVGRLKNMHDEINDMSIELNQNYKEWKDMTYEEWQEECNKCIELQKEWMKTRQAMLYALNNLNDTIDTNINNFDDVVDAFVKSYNNNADKQIEKYYFDCLVWEQLNDK